MERFWHLVCFEGVWTLVRIQVLMCLSHFEMMKYGVPTTLHKFVKFLFLFLAHNDLLASILDFLFVFFFLLIIILIAYCFVCWFGSFLFGLFFLFFLLVLLHLFSLLVFLDGLFCIFFGFFFWVICCLLDLCLLRFFANRFFFQFFLVISYFDCFKFSVSNFYLDF
jgi:hypothetical protein